MLNGCVSGGSEAHRLNTQSHKYTAKVNSVANDLFIIIWTLGTEFIPEYYYGYSNISYDEALEQAFQKCRKRKHQGCKEDKGFRTVKNNSYNNSNTSSSQTNYASVDEHKDIILSAKSSCKKMGFKENTEGMASCTKDVYLKLIENENNNTTTITAVPKRTIDPSVWDDLLNISKGMGEGKTFTESLGGVSSSSSSSSNVQCFKTGERVSGTNKICSYNCMGSEVVQNISSTSICALSIDLN